MLRAVGIAAIACCTSAAAETMLQCKPDGATAEVPGFRVGLDIEAKEARFFSLGDAGPLMPATVTEQQIEVRHRVKDVNDNEVLVLRFTLDRFTLRYSMFNAASALLKGIRVPASGQCEFIRQKL